MKTHGTLAKWNEERGFGFIQSAVGSEEIFVHVSAFPPDGVRPAVGELISFQTELRADGKKRAVDVRRPASRAAPHRTPFSSPRVARRSPLPTLAALLLITVIGWYGYTRHEVRQPAPPAPVALEIKARPVAPAQVFHCDGRTMCPQMTSCAEATYFLQQCPGVQMDGDGDGVPCERQWCGRESFD